MGGRKYQRLSLSYFKSASAILFCYRDDDPSSLEQALSWVQAVKTKHLDTDVVMMLVNCSVQDPPACVVHYDLTQRPAEDRSYTVHGAFAPEGVAKAKEHGLVYVECDAIKGDNVAQVFGVAVVEAFVLKYQQLYSERQRKRIQRALSRADIRKLFNTLAQKQLDRTGRAPTEDEELALVQQAEAETREKERLAAILEDEDRLQKEKEDEDERMKQQERRRVAEEEAAEAERQRLAEAAEEDRRKREEEERELERARLLEEEAERERAIREAEEAEKLRQEEIARTKASNPYVNERGERLRVITRRIDSTRQLILSSSESSQDHEEAIDSSIYDNVSTADSVLSAPATLLAFPFVKLLDYISSKTSTSEGDIEEPTLDNSLKQDVYVMESGSRTFVEKNIVS
jgi:GTPase SAR1 family protein